MHRIILIALFISLFGAYEARRPHDLNKMLGIDEESRGTEEPVNNLKGEHKNEPGTFPGSDFAFSKFISHPDNIASIEAARRKLSTGDVEMYMPAKVTAAECYVEFQVTERVPGRCTRLAGSIPACQAEKYVGINYSECN